MPQTPQSVLPSAQPVFIHAPTDTKDHNMPTDQTRKDYDRIAKAIRYIADNSFDQPELSTVAEATGLSEYHFQRLFTRWAGVSPKKFLQYLTLQYAKDSLARSASILDATFDSGLSGPGRLHDLFVNLEAVTPGEYKSRGDGLVFRYATHTTRFGECLAVETSRGLAGLSFIEDGDRDAALAEQKVGWENATWVADPTAGENVVARTLSVGTSPTAEKPVSLLLRGSPYQMRVWEALLEIPTGATATYAEISEKIGYGGKAARACANACAANRIGILIPCHRVIRSTGMISGYRWGTVRKRAVLAYEAADLDREMRATA